jgi:hypothetical protein
MIKYTIDMKLYDEFGPDFLNAIEEYICVELYNTLNEKDILDLHVINWDVNLNIGIYYERIPNIIPNLIQRLKNGITDEETKAFFIQKE